MSNGLPLKESMFTARKLQEPFQGQLLPLPFELSTDNKGQYGEQITGDMDPMTRWVSQGKADEPWHILDIVGNSDEDQLIEPGVEEVEDEWSVEVEHGSVQG